MKRMERGLTRGRTMLLAFCGLAVAVLTAAIAVRGWSAMRHSVTAAVGRGTADLQQWIGRQILALANNYLRPELTFLRLEYQPPGTILLAGVALRDGVTEVLAARELRIELDRLPEVGRPIVIRQVTLVEPVVRLVRHADGRLAGFDDLIESTTGSTGADGGSTRLSDVFAIDQIRIIDGSVTYEQPDHPPMTIDRVTLDLTCESAGDEPGWYALAARLARDPVLRLDVDSRINIDDLVIDLGRVAVEMAVAPAQYSLLPPELQSWLLEHEVTGRLELAATGRIPLRTPAACDVRVQASLDDARLAVGDYVLPVRRLDTDLSIGGGVATVDRAAIEVLGGEIGVVARAELRDDLPANFRVSARDLRLEQLLRHPTEGEPPIAGRLAGHLDGTTSLQDPAGAVRADGRVDLDQGRLVSVPVVSRLLRLMDRLPMGTDWRDRGSADLVVTDRKARLPRLEFVCATIAARGTGQVGFDASLYLQLNAGPLERVQQMLGKAGQLFGRITDTIVTYEVTGTIQDPAITVRPLGVGAAAPDW